MPYLPTVSWRYGSILPGRKLLLVLWEKIEDVIGLLLFVVVISVGAGWMA